MAKTSTKVAGAAGGIAAVAALAIPLVATWEGLSLDPYKDLIGTGKPWTVCYGSTGVEMRRYTKTECDVLLERELIKHAEPILDCLPADAPLTVKAAFVSWGYNVGVGAACASTATKLANALDYRGACAQLSRWTMSGGKVRKGLVRRRADERRLCESGLA
jgi:lysozyme